MTIRPYRQCTHCILDTNDDPEISFDEAGVCSYCLAFENQKKRIVREGAQGEKILGETLQKIKEYGRNRKYDCLIGLSGGVDSSYVAYLAKQYGLRALCVHFDNGWNSELAVMNIHNIVSKLNYDLKTWVIDWEEFKDLQLAYLKASVVDIEAITDHAIYGTMYKIARENDIKYILGGHNIVTEGVLPYHWTFNKLDHINIRNIHARYGTTRLKTFPFLNSRLKKFIRDSGVEIINYLNWVPYHKNHVKQLLQQELGWRDYGGKHYESMWTKFYQGYILPVKFHIDKRKAHYSTLICSGQMTREEALDAMKEPLYSPEKLKEEMEYVIKKFQLSEKEFNDIMALPIKNQWDFGWEGSVFERYTFLKFLQPLWHLIKKSKR